MSNDVIEVLKDFRELADELFQLERIDEQAYSELIHHLVVTESEYAEPKGDCCG